MRHVTLLCALCCAGCATWRSGATPTFSTAPAGPHSGDWTPAQSDAAPAAASPTPNGGFSTSRPAGPTPAASTPIGPTPTYAPETTIPRRTQPLDSGAAPYRGTLSAPTPQAPAGRAPATAEPTSTDFAPRIPDPNAALPAPTHAAGRPAPTAAPHQRVNTTTSESTALAWRTVGRSSGGRPIEMLQLGRGEQHLLLTASLVGNERDSVAFVEGLASLLQREPQRLGDFTIVCIRTPNPDGYADATLTNSRGVALNRNFPSRNFFGQRTAETGLTEASEPETQAILNLCEDFRPDRVVHVRAGQAARTLVLANPAAVTGLRERIDRSLLDGGEFEAYKAGSIEEYTTERLQTELLMVALPSDARSWRNELGRFCAVLIGPPASAIRPASQTPSQPAATIAPTSAAEARADASQRTGRPDLFAPYPTSPAVAASTGAPAAGRRGYVELLPPPPDQADAPAGHDAKFYALPPPPE